MVPRAHGYGTIRNWAKSPQLSRFQSTQKHFLQTRPPWEGAGWPQSPRAEETRGQDLAGERGVKPTGLSLLPGLPRKLPTPLPTLPNGFLGWEMRLGLAGGRGRRRRPLNSLLLWLCNPMSQPCRGERPGPSWHLGPPVLSCGQRGLPAGTSTRPVHASASGGLSDRAHGAAKAGHRKPNSDVQDPLGR